MFNIEVVFTLKDDDGDNESVGSEESDITSVHTRQNGSKDRSIDGSKTGGGSLVSRGSRGSGSKTSSQVLNANEAVADMAVGLVTLLVDLLAVISSPSTIRAKVHILKFSLVHYNYVSVFFMVYPSCVWRLVAISSA